MCFRKSKDTTYREMPPAGDWPDMSFSQASAHSCTTSMAYLHWLVYSHDEIRERGDILGVLAFAGEGELVLWLAVRDLVDTEPLVGGSEEAREVAFDILDVIELGSKRVVDVDDNDLPVSLLLVEQGHDAEDLDLLDLAGVADELADLADVERVVVSLGLGLRVDDIGVFPGLFELVLAYLPPLFTLMHGWRAHSLVGRHRSSRGSPCGGSSCGRNAVCPSWCPA